MLVLDLRRKAKEVKRYVILTRVLGLLVIILVAVVAIAYAISYFYDKYGSFTVKVNKYDMMRQGLTLSETPEFEKAVAVLNADIVYDMTNISGEDLPKNIDMVNGSHNGESYIAYTFYLINSGSDTVSSAISSGVSGRVKQIFAQKGSDVVACMVEHGALAVLSLDGSMALRFSTPTGLEMGQTVTVIMSAEPGM